MPYQIPDQYGNLITFDDDVSKADAQAYIQKVIGGTAQKKESKNIFRDVSGALVSGLGSLYETAGTLGTLAGADPDNLLSKSGQGLKYLSDEYIKSPGLRTQEEEIAARLAELESKDMGEQVVGTLGAAFTNPYWLMTKGVEQIPQLIVGGGVGKGAQVATRALATKELAGLAAKTAVETAAQRNARAAAIGTFGAMQGADVAQQTFNDIMALTPDVLMSNEEYQGLRNQGMSHEEAQQEIALRAARDSFGKAAALSALTASAMPGIEKGMFGGLGTKTRLGAVGKGFLGEAGQETLEEGGGQYISGLDVSQYDPTRDPLAGVGVSGALGGALGGIMGGAVGGIRGPEGAAPPVEPKTLITAPVEGEQLTLPGFEEPGPASALPTPPDMGPSGPAGATMVPVLDEKGQPTGRYELKYEAPTRFVQELPVLDDAQLRPLLDAGLKKQSALYKQLKNLDLTKPEDQVKAGQVVQAARLNTKLSPEQKAAVEQVAMNAFRVASQQASLFEEGVQDGQTRIEPEGAVGVGETQPDTGTTEPSVGAPSAVGGTEAAGVGAGTEVGGGSVPADVAGSVEGGDQGVRRLSTLTETDPEAIALAELGKNIEGLRADYRALQQANKERGGKGYTTPESILERIQSGQSNLDPAPFQQEIDLANQINALDEDFSKRQERLFAKDRSQIYFPLAPKTAVEEEQVGEGRRIELPGQEVAAAPVAEGVAAPEPVVLEPIPNKLKTIKAISDEYDQFGDTEDKLRAIAFDIAAKTTPAFYEKKAAESKLGRANAQKLYKYYSDNAAAKKQLDANIDEFKKLLEKGDKRDIQRVEDQRRKTKKQAAEEARLDRNIERSKQIDEELAAMDQEEAAAREERDLPASTAFDPSTWGTPESINAKFAAYQKQVNDKLDENEQRIVNDNGLDINLDQAAEIQEAAKGGTESIIDTVLKQLAGTKFADVLKAIRPFLKGVEVKITKVGDKVPAILNGFGVRALASTDPRTGKTVIYLNDSSVSGKVGTQPLTFLHEGIHAATVERISLGEADYKRRKDTAAARAYKDTLDLFNAVVKHTNNLINNVKELEDLPAVVQAAYKRQNNSLKNLKEMVAWALSDVEFQKYLESIPYKQEKSVLGKFIDILKAIFNIGKDAVNAFEAAVINVGSILNVPESALEERRIELNQLASAIEPVVNPMQVAAESPKILYGANGPISIMGGKADPVQTPGGVGRIFSKATMNVKPSLLNEIMQKFVNDRQYIKVWEEKLRAAGKLISVGKINNVYEQLTLAPGRAERLNKLYVEGLRKEIDKQIGAYAEKTGLSTEQAASNLGLYAEALHEAERRAVKFYTTVELTDENALKRDFIMKQIYSGEVSTEEAVNLRKQLENIVDNDTQAKTYDINSDKFNVSELTVADRNAILAQMRNDKGIEEAKKILDWGGLVQQVHDRAIDLNRQANYWTKPVDVIKAFYGWKNYVPLKGRPGMEDETELFNFDGRRVSGELQDRASAFEGRESAVENPVLRSLADATQAALRAGRVDVTESIKNAVENKQLPGKIVKTISFGDRHFEKGLDQYRGPKYIYHYNQNGSVDVIELSDEKQREAIRRTYRQTNPMLDALNTVTSTIGQYHTRYNLNFPALNFLRDMLTNAFIVGAEFGPRQAARFIGSIASEASRGGMYKTSKFVYLYNNNRVAEAEAMAAQDPFLKDLAEYVRQGGRISYLQGLATKGQFDQLQGLTGKGGVKAKVARTKAQIDQVFDYWVDSFELAARTIAYKRIKDIIKTQNPNLTDEAIQVQAAAYVKNLANFEQHGQYGKALGAMFMFFRPSATGAARSLEALLKGPYGKEMAAVLMGMGSAVYLMAAALSDDDDQGRNKVLTDDLARWNRYARFHISDDLVIQIPWGFGLGGFAAAGAQLTGMFTGSNSVGEVLNNVRSIAMDSFLPLPVSQISPTDNFSAFLLDSVTPSAGRPLLQYAMNINGLGQAIYPNNYSRYADAYAGSTRVPDSYNKLARALYDSTNGALDISPNSLYFFSNSYFDGPGRMLAWADGAISAAMGNKTFDPRADLPVVGSFFSTPSNIDAKDYAKAENKLKDFQRRLNTAKTDPQRYKDFVTENREEIRALAIYNSMSNHALRSYREQFNKIARDPNLNAAQRKEKLDKLRDAQSIAKRRIIDAVERTGFDY